MVGKKLLCQLEAFRARRITPLCHGLIHPGQKVLDLGSGSGHIAERIRKIYGIEIACLDIVDYNRSNVPLTVYDGKRIPFKKERFDTVLLFFVLHHALEPVQLLEEIKRILKIDGTIIILEDVYNSRIERWTTLALDSINHINPVKTPFGFKTMEEWKQLFGALGLIVSDTKPFRISCPPSVRNIRFVLTKQP